MIHLLFIDLQWLQQNFPISIMHWMTRKSMEKFILRIEF